MNIKLIGIIVLLFYKSVYATSGLHPTDSLFYAKTAEILVNRPQLAAQRLDSAYQFLTPDDENWHIWHLSRARSCIPMGQYDSSLAICFKGLKTLRNDDIRNKADYYKQIGVTYYYLRQLRLSLETFRSVIPLAEKTLEDTALLVALYSNMGGVMMELGRSDSARLLLERSISYSQPYYNRHREENEPTYPYRILATYHQSKGNYDKALNLYQTALKSSYQTGDTLQIIAALLFYGDLLLLNGASEEAFKDYFTALKYARRINTPDGIMEVFKHLKVAYRDIGNFTEAYAMGDSVLKMQITIYQEDLSMKISELETHYETDKLKQQNLLTQSQLDAAIAKNNARNIIIASLLVIGLIIIFMAYNLIRQQRLKKEKAEQEGIIKLQDERLRISRDLHDNIGAHITYIISSLDNLEWRIKNTSHKSLRDIDTINEFARSTMQQLRDTVWVMKHNTLSLNDLELRLKDTVSRIDELTSQNISIHSNCDENISLDSGFTLDIYRIVQEALQNAVKHAKARKITVNLKCDGQALEISVADNGIGFSPSQVRAGNGLGNMESRAREKNMKIKIDSTPGSGTTITLRGNISNTLSNQ